MTAQTDGPAAAGTANGAKAETRKRPAPKVAAPCKRLKWDNDPTLNERQEAVDRWTFRLCEARLGARAMRVAAFIIRKHWSTTGAITYGPEEIQKATGMTDREFRFGRDDLARAGFIVWQWDHREHRKLWCMALPTNPVEKRTGTNRTAQTGTNRTGEPVQNVPPEAPKPVQNVPETGTNRTAYLSSIPEEKDITGVITEGSKSAPASGGRACQRNSSPENQECRKVEDNHAIPKDDPLDDELDELGIDRSHTLANPPSFDDPTEGPPHAPGKIRPIGRLPTFEL